MILQFCFRFNILDNFFKYLKCKNAIIKNGSKSLIYIYIYICISYNMGKRDLPDIYALARGPQAQGRGHIYQANPDCPCYK